MNLNWVVAAKNQLTLDKFELQPSESFALKKEKVKWWHDAKIRHRLFRVGDLVLIFNSWLKLFPGKRKSK